MKKAGTLRSFELDPYVPESLRALGDLQTAIPAIARDEKRMREVEEAVRRLPTTHHLAIGDARKLAVAPESVHLVMTSPPYWTLKRYREHEGQLGHWEDYETFLRQLDMVWRRCFKALVPGGRLVCVVGDVCLSRRKNQGRHQVVPLHASIQEHCRRLGYDNLAPIFWHKIANAVYEVGNGGGFLGKPYEPNAVIKHDVEFLLMERKPGGYRKPSRAKRLLSVVSAQNHQRWFRQIWSDVSGASTRQHPAPFPLELAERMVRMFSFAGDTVLDPFLGTGTTTVAAARWGRNSIGYEVDPEYMKLARSRIAGELDGLFSTAQIVCHETK